MEQYFLWYKAIHVISVICWMAGILYMPRLLSYHADTEIGSEAYEKFCIMERRLLRIIMNPAMILTYIFGSLVAYIYGLVALGTWFHIKIFCVLCLTFFHHILAIWIKGFASKKNKHSSKFYRIMNEIPTILMIIIVILVIVKPFE